MLSVGAGNVTRVILSRVRLSLLIAGMGALGLLAACTQAPAPTIASSVSSTGSASPSSSNGAGITTPATTSADATPTPTPTPTKATPTVAVGKPVHVSLLENDGGVYGVGLPIIAWFNVAPTDATAFAKATTVTVNGSAAAGAWYFESTKHAGSALEAHFRLAGYWPAHSSIKLNLPVKGMSAGKGLVFDDSLTLAMSTGAAHISTVNAVTLVMTVMSDGKLYGRFPVSLGASNTPTARGTKVIMEKGKDISMTGPGYYDPHVQWTQRLTYGGEYLHSAPWNVANIGSRSTSNGCTNLLPAQAQQLYKFMSIGDVVLYPNANGPQMTLGAGYGDWNVSWAEWQTGGALAT
jgi:lipoprotein-anchoring transpeptidase ErfK/SrfK